MRKPIDDIVKKYNRLYFLLIASKHNQALLKKVAIRAAETNKTTIEEGAYIGALLSSISDYILWSSSVQEGYLTKFIQKTRFLLENINIYFEKSKPVKNRLNNYLILVINITVEFLINSFIATENPSTLKMLLLAKKVLTKIIGSSTLPENSLVECASKSILCNLHYVTAFVMHQAITPAYLDVKPFCDPQELRRFIRIELEHLSKQASSNHELKYMRNIYKIKLFMVCFYQKVALSQKADINLLSLNMIESFLDIDADEIILLVNTTSDEFKPHESFYICDDLAIGENIHISLAKEYYKALNTAEECCDYYLRPIVAEALCEVSESVLLKSLYSLLTLKYNVLNNMKKYLDAIPSLAFFNPAELNNKKLENLAQISETTESIRRMWISKKNAEIKSESMLNVLNYEESKRSSVCEKLTVALKPKEKTLHPTLEGRKCAPDDEKNKKSPQSTNIDEFQKTESKRLMFFLKEKLFHEAAIHFHNLKQSYEQAANITDIMFIYLSLGDIYRCWFQKLQSKSSKYKSKKNLSRKYYTKLIDSINSIESADEGLIEVKEFVGSILEEDANDSSKAAKNIVIHSKIEEINISTELLESKMDEDQQEEKARNLTMPLPHYVEIVIKKLHEKNYQAYIVGGAVRDFVLGKELDDYDIVTDAYLTEVNNILKGEGEIVGMRHPIFLIKDKPKTIQISTMASKYSTKEVHLVSAEKWVSVIYPTNKINIDVKTRDFTINSLYYCHQKKIIYDPTTAFQDIANKKVNFINPIENSLQDDPSLILRLIRVACKCQLTITGGIEKVVRANIHLLSTLNPARLNFEITKTLSQEKIHDVLSLLNNYGIIKHLYTTGSENGKNYMSSFILDVINNLKRTDYSLIWVTLLYFHHQQMIAKHQQLVKNFFPQYQKDLYNMLKQYGVPYFQHANILQIFTAHYGMISKEVVNLVAITISSSNYKNANFITKLLLGAESAMAHNFYGTKSLPAGKYSGLDVQSALKIAVNGNKELIQSLRSNVSGENLMLFIIPEIISSTHMFMSAYRFIMSIANDILSTAEDGFTFTNTNSRGVVSMKFGSIYSALSYKILIDESLALGKARISSQNLEEPQRPVEKAIKKWYLP